MKFVVAPDSFKGSISAFDVCRAVKEGIHKAIPEAEVVIKPIADGGEGTLDAMVSPDCRTAVRVSGPNFKKINAEYGYIGDAAVIEMARAAGLTLLPEEKRNAGKTTTFGVGELILHALKSGFRKIMLTAGGSATNDGGCGMLSALGVEFLKKDGSKFIPIGDTLAEIEKIDVTKIADGFFDTEFLIATDVKNPLLGKEGATYVYAPQKGLESGQKELLEAGMAHFASVLERTFGKKISSVEGCGAGGGIAAGLLALTNAKISSGIDTVLEVIDFDSALDGADAVLTGEGKIDAQSLFGKAISGVAKMSFERSVPVYCFVGCIGDDEEKLRSLGLSGIYDVASLASSKEDSMENAHKYLAEIAKRFASEFLAKKGNLTH